jgi:hypothetical protein
MDILIESTKNFENDLPMLSDVERGVVIAKINDLADLSSTHKSSVFRKLRRLDATSLIGSYESSLYTLKVSAKWFIILSVDEDPIFDQLIFTLFRVVPSQDLQKAYQVVAQSLYQDFLTQDREVVRAS